MDMQMGTGLAVLARKSPYASAVPADTLWFPIDQHAFSATHHWLSNLIKAIANASHTSHKASKPHVHDAARLDLAAMLCICNWN